MTPTSIDIPEILMLISTHLDLKHMVPCTLVNRAWYAAFAPLLFKKIGPCNAKSIAFERYCAHATQLSIFMLSPIFKVIASKCTRLTELNVRGLGSSSTTISKEWIDFLQNNPQIVKVIALKLSPASLAILASHCPNLKELVLHGIEWGDSIQDNTTERVLATPLWRIAQGLTSLDLRFHMFPVPTLVPEPPEDLPMMRHLVLGTSYFPLTECVQLIRAARNLETLTWELQHYGMEERLVNFHMFRRLFESLLPLRELSLAIPPRAIFSEGQILPHFLMLLPPCVKSLEVVSTNRKVKSPQIVQPLSRQFLVLETLDIRAWDVRNMVEVVLRSCPLLRVFYCKTLKVKLTNETIVLSGSDVGHSGIGPLGWVCTGLETLLVECVDCSSAMRRPLFDQLCCMKEFIFVKLHGFNSADLLWEKGEMPRVWGDQLIEKDEITSIPWMREMWPRLKFFHTTFNAQSVYIL